MSVKLVRKSLNDELGPLDVVDSKGVLSGAGKVSGLVLVEFVNWRLT